MNDEPAELTEKKQRARRIGLIAIGMGLYPFAVLLVFLILLGLGLDAFESIFSLLFASSPLAATVAIFLGHVTIRSVDRLMSEMALTVRGGSAIILGYLWWVFFCLAGAPHYSGPLFFLGVVAAIELPRMILFVRRETPEPTIAAVILLFLGTWWVLWRIPDLFIIGAVGTVEIVLLAAVLPFRDIPGLTNRGRVKLLIPLYVFAAATVAWAWVRYGQARF